MSTKKPRQPPVDGGPADEPRYGHSAVAGVLAGSDSTAYVSIDPGGDGAVAVLCGRLYAVVDIPALRVAVTRTKKLNAEAQALTGKKTKRQKGTTTEFDLAAVHELFGHVAQYRSRVVVALEQAPVSTGPGRAHGDVMLNRAYAMWPLYLYSLGLRVEEYRPSVWKQKLGLAGKDKNASRRKAMALFPQAPLSRVGDHNRAEALLIAYYCRLIHVIDITS